MIFINYKKISYLCLLLILCSCETEQTAIKAI